MGSEPLPRVLIRVITSPVTDKGERLAIYIDSRTLADPSVVVYSFTKDEWRTELHRVLMRRSRRATPMERTEASQALAHIGEDVRVLQSAPPLFERTDETDEAPVDPEYDE